MFETSTQETIWNMNDENQDLLSWTLDILCFVASALFTLLSHCLIMRLSIGCLLQVVRLYWLAVLYCTELYCTVPE